MNRDSNWIAIIPARQGSKRLPNKNLLKLGDLSLIEIAVKKAIQSKAFSKVLISSDSSEIINKACKLGAEAVGGLRKKELSGDHIKTIDVVKDLLRMEELKTVNGFTIVQCTSPFTSINTINEVTNNAKISNTSSISIKRIEHTYLEWLLIKNEKYIEPIMSETSNSNIRSQDATEIFSPSGNAYSVNKSYFLTHDSLIVTESIPFLIENKDELIDIDNKEDYEKALSIFKNKFLKK